MRRLLNWKFYVRDVYYVLQFLKILTFCIAVIFKHLIGVTDHREQGIHLQGVKFLCPKGMPELIGMNKWKAHMYKNGFERAAEVLKNNN